MKKFEYTLGNAVKSARQEEKRHFEKINNIANAIFMTLMLSGIIYACVIIPLTMR